MLRALILVAVATPITASAASLPSGPVPRLSPGKQEAVDAEIRTSDNLRLAGTYYPPEQKKTLRSNPAPGVLLVHDAGGNRGQLTDIALRLQKSGFGVLTVDLRGHGESRGGKDRAWADLKEDDQNRLWALATRDIEAASQWLLSQEQIHSTNLSVVGLGSGCALAVRHAKRDENVRCVALLAPRSKDFGFDVAADLQKIEGLPTFVLADKDDDATKAMVAEANDGGHPYVEIDYATARVNGVLEDRKTPSKVASWIKNCAMPKRGRG